LKNSRTSGSRRIEIARFWLRRYKHGLIRVKGFIRPIGIVRDRGLELFFGESVEARLIRCALKMPGLVPREPRGMPFAHFASLGGR